jgi:hypothetical protein
MNKRKLIFILKQNQTMKGYVSKSWWKSLEGVVNYYSFITALQSLHHWC